MYMEGLFSGFGLQCQDIQEGILDSFFGAKIVLAAVVVGLITEVDQVPNLSQHNKSKFVNVSLLLNRAQLEK